MALGNRWFRLTHVRIQSMLHSCPRHCTVSTTSNDTHADHLTLAELQSSLKFYQPSKQVMKRVKKLGDGRLRKTPSTTGSRSIFLEGHRLVLDAIQADLYPSEVFLCERAVAAPLGRSLLSSLLLGQQARAVNGSSGHAPVLYWVTTDVMSSFSATCNTQGVCATVPLPEDSFVSGWSHASSLVVCDGVADPGNVGTIIRSCHSLGVDGVAVVGGCDPWSPKVIRSSMGFGLKFPVCQLSWPDSRLKELLEGSTGAGPGEGRAVYLAENTSDAIPYSDCDFVSPFVLVIGSEAHGISDEIKRVAMHASSSSGGLKCRSIKIPLVSSAESLNAAVACAMILGEARRQRLVAGVQVVDHDR